MITEDFCSYEVAQLLKEKGFDELCDNYYGQSSDEPQQLTLDELYYSNDKFIKAPTHQMAMKWLREKDIRICLDYSDVDGKWFAMIGTKKKRTYSGYYDTYEEAVEAACIYSLENLL